MWCGACLWTVLFKNRSLITIYLQHIDHQDTRIRSSCILWALTSDSRSSCEQHPTAGCDPRKVSIVL